MPQTNGNGMIVKGVLIYDVLLSEFDKNKRFARGSVVSEYNENPWHINYTRLEGNMISDKNYTYRICQWPSSNS